MASDSQIMGEFIEQLSFDKILVIDSYIVGCAGLVRDIKQFIAYINNGWREIDIPLEKPDSLESLIYDSNTKEIMYYDGSYLGIKTGNTTAIGSGQSFAMGAMLNGASALEAISIAARLDPYTGGDVKFCEVDSSEVKDMSLIEKDITLETTL